jgi:hypothetical protein
MFSIGPPVFDRNVRSGFEPDRHNHQLHFKVLSLINCTPQPCLSPTATLQTFRYSVQSLQPRYGSIIIYTVEKTEYNP